MRTRLAGFTLIEIMLVMVLLSLTAVAVIATLPESKDDQIEKLARRFFHQTQLLNEEALLNGFDYGIWVEEDKNRFKFGTLTLDGWRLIDDNPLYTETKLENDLALRLQLGSKAWGDDDRLFKPGSLFDDEMFASEEQKKKLDPPTILLAGSGEITPFQLAFFPSNGDDVKDSWRIKVSEAGVVQLLMPGELGDEENQ
ncbi:prepilin-type N-terminal cleavage/methylation domain-containing protein [Vibrio sp. SCSIO 43136]|uniref:prepilin-type N-terminal cleavage/methylation domain-containing protein n=1 Tax=Vibrio sp. SCSIO 43136 TaxID=2819101 RepID=UPI002075D074|nr:prepilin-type N-terminal cleavage/methylation domain-containing protein [Vibrio sp. SCSIO 43136]USD66730.1 GspH/FimT family pseudopilin [Vibrio sp. SCSIO 43136]